jgi:hypothetical protein
MTVTISGNWLGAGNKAYFDFGNVTTGTAVPDGVYTAETSTSTDTLSGTNLTILAPDTTARSGRVRMVRFAGSFTVSNSGLPPPNEKRITLDTTSGGIANHHLSVGDPVYLNFTVGNPKPSDAEFVVESVPDANTFTVTTTLAAVGGANDSDNGMWMFPLVSQPLTRSGSVNLLPGTFNMGLTDTDLSQTPLNSPTVFNFFLPDYKYAGALASQGITTPEFQDTSETTVIRQGNFFYNGIFNPANVNGISSFKTGGHALVMDFSPWTGNATDLGLGAGANPALPWTDNANLDSLIDKLNILLVSGQLPAAVKPIIQNLLTHERTVSAITLGNPCTITTSAAHGLTTGDGITLSGVTGGTFSPTINATYTVTVTGANTFTVPVNYSSASGVNITAARASYVPYNNTTPTDTNKRDRIRAIVHLILNSPDFVIQR